MRCTSSYIKQANITAVERKGEKLFRVSLFFRLQIGRLEPPNTALTVLLRADLFSPHPGLPEPPSSLYYPMRRCALTSVYSARIPPKFYFPREPLTPLFPYPPATRPLAVLIYATPTVFGRLSSRQKPGVSLLIDDFGAAKAF